jgi:hypothetical protein
MITRYSTTNFLQTTGNAYLCRTPVITNETYIQLFLTPLCLFWPSLKNFQKDFEEASRLSNPGDYPKSFILEYKGQRGPLFILHVPHVPIGEQEKRQLVRYLTEQQLLQLKKLSRFKTVVVNTKEFFLCESDKDKWEWFQIFTTVPVKFVLCLK